MSAYQLLGVPKTASADDIRNAYKEKAMLNHPDRGGSQEAWQAIQKAFDTLSDLLSAAARCAEQARAHPPECAVSAFRCVAERTFIYEGVVAFCMYVKLCSSIRAISCNE